MATVSAGFCGNKYQMPWMARGICPARRSQMMVARSRQVPYTGGTRRAGMGTGTPELVRKCLCEPLLWNG